MRTIQILGILTAGTVPAFYLALYLMAGLNVSCIMSYAPGGHPEGDVSCKFIDAIHNHLIPIPLASIKVAETH